MLLFAIIGHCWRYPVHIVLQTFINTRRLVYNQHLLGFYHFLEIHDTFGRRVHTELSSKIEHLLWIGLLHDLINVVVTADAYALHGLRGKIDTIVAWSAPLILW